MRCRFRFEIEDVVLKKLVQMLFDVDHIALFESNPFISKRLTNMMDVYVNYESSLPEHTHWIRLEGRNIASELCASEASADNQISTSALV